MARETEKHFTPSVAAVVSLAWVMLAGVKMTWFLFPDSRQEFMDLRLGYTTGIIFSGSKTSLLTPSLTLLPEGRKPSPTDLSLSPSCY